jgi:hypothetical protein
VGLWKALDMERSRYEQYLSRFNARDYAGVLEFYAAEFEVAFAGVQLRGAEQLIRYRLRGGRFVQVDCAVIGAA